MFTASAEVYDAIYHAFKDYAAEAAEIARRLKAEHPAARTVLDVGCGTGEHARLLAADAGFTVDGLDLNADFLRLAEQKHPAGRFHLADMTSFDVTGRYDAIVCLFSSIGYVRTLAALEGAFRCFRKHLAPSGVILVEPWFPPEAMEPGRPTAVRSVELGPLRVVRTSTTEVRGRISHLRFQYELTEEGRTERFTEMHELGLFTEAETLAAFRAAGLDASHDQGSSFTRSLYVARAG